MEIVKLLMFENGFYALKRALSYWRNIGRILCHLTLHVKSFFLPIAARLELGYYHMVISAVGQQTLFRP